MYLDVLWGSQNVQHCVCHVLGLQAVKGRSDSCCPRWVARVHRLLELSLNEAGRNRRHPDVSSKFMMRQAGFFLPDV